MTATSVRLPPHSIEAEQAVLGGVLLEPRCLDDLDDLRASDFYRDAHRLIFDAMQAIRRRGGDPDAVTVYEHLRAAGKDLPTEAVENHRNLLAALVALAEGCPSAANAGHYARIVIEHGQVRHVLAACAQTTAEGYAPLADVQAWLAEAEGRLHVAVERGGRVEVPAQYDAARDVLRHLDDIGAGRISAGTSTGLANIDAHIGGLRGGNIYLIAATTGCGKSALAWRIATHVARTQPVAYFNYEMPRLDLSLRFLAMTTGIDLGRIQRFGSRARNIAGLDGAEDLAAAAAAYAALHVATYDASGFTPRDIAACCRRVARQNDGRLALVVVDYAQLVTPVDGDNREQEIAGISRGLKGLAMGMRVPVLLLSQLNKQARVGECPQLGSVRESSALENDASVILFPWSKYEEKTLRHVHVAKNRMGPTGEFDLAWNGPTTRFDDPPGAAQQDTPRYPYAD